MVKVLIVGGGLAGSEAAFQSAERGVEVELLEMRPLVKTHAHVSDKLAELVCSNSFRADDYLSSAIGLLHQEMRILNSLIMKVADEVRVPAGSALAVDREEFSQKVTDIISSHPLIKITRGEFKGWDGDYFFINDEKRARAYYSRVIIATGPLTSESLSANILKNTDELALNFFDAMAPIIFHDSIDFDKAWYQSRYDKGLVEGDVKGGDYINCPMSKEQYYEFVDELMKGEKAEFKEWERDIPYFDGCLPIEVMAERGGDTLRFGPLKPVGLTNPHFEAGDIRQKPYAVVQLRQDNKHGSLYNMVGFQTKLKHAEQVRVFKTIPGLENARFARLGGIHRNSYLNGPELLDEKLRLKSDLQIRFAGQVSGVEGYVESAAMGLMCGIFAACDAREFVYEPPTERTAMGALIAHVCGMNLGEHSQAKYQPMNVNFGLFPKFEGQIYDENDKRLRGRKLRAARREKIALNAIEEIQGWLVGK